jgi:hypothetical protein
MRIPNFIKLIIIFCILVVGCVEPYSPPALNQTINYLVVDGFVDTKNGTASVLLNHAQGLSDQNIPVPILFATVTLEGNDNSSVELHAGSPDGFYEKTGLLLSNDIQYRLRIKTKTDKEYLSEFITPKVSPPIDSVTWKPVSDGIEIRVNTHDDTNNSKYYSWSCDETWTYHSPFTSRYKYVGGQILFRQPEDDISTCFRNDRSSNISLGSSLKFNKDIIQESLVHFVKRGDERLSAHYSILVKQVVLSREAYDFQENLKKTTEQLGGLFDPQPGLVVGNVHCIDTPSETVLGYFNGGTITEKRLFIRVGQLPIYLIVPPTKSDCTIDTLPLEAVPTFVSDWLIIDGIYNPGLTGYSITPKACADCREQGGYLEKPSFWP